MRYLLKYILKEGEQMIKVNARKRGNNLYNRRIAVLVLDGFTPYQIYTHIMIDEKATYDNAPISWSTVYNRATLYQKNRADLERWYNNEMPADEAKTFAKRMKLA